MKLFISYAPSDRAQIEDLAKTLVESGHEAVIDHDLSSEARWERVLRETLSDCDALVYVSSRDASKSEWCKREYRTAKKGKLPIIPVIFTAAAAAEVPADLKTLGAVDLSAGAGMLVSGLAAVSNTLQARTGSAEVAEAQADDESDPVSQLVELTGDVSPELQALLKQANDYLLAGKWEKAIGKLNELAKQIPENAMLYAARGDSYAGLKQYDKALEDYNAVIRMEPENSKAYDTRANLLRDMDRNDEALADFTEAIRLDPEHAFPHVSRGMLYYLQGKVDEALADFQAYAQKTPDDYLGHNNVAFVLFQQGRYEEAEAAWRTATSLEEPDDYVFAGHAVALEQLQRPAEALEQYRKAVQINRRWKNKLDTVGAEYSWTEPMLVLATQIIGRLRAR